jgi:predicted enzyme related to lactoylglutathione lyase
MGQPVVHFEIGVGDREKAEAFYGALFGWKIDRSGPASLIDTGGGTGINGHITSLGHEPHHYVTFYAAVDDLPACLAKAESLGGRTLVPPVDIPAGTFAWLADPDGNTVGIWKWRTTGAGQDDRGEIRLLLGRITAAWRQGRTEDLRDCFHEGMVIAPPGFRGRVEGRDACVRSYADFLAHATVREFKEAEPAIDVCGDTAVATCPWEMEWEAGGEVRRETGHDVFVLARREGKWLAVWRTVAPTERR